MKFDWTMSDIEWSLIYVISEYIYYCVLRMLQFWNSHYQIVMLGIVDFDDVTSMVPVVVGYGVAYQNGMGIGL